MSELLPKIAPERGHATSEWRITLIVAALGALCIVCGVLLSSTGGDQEIAAQLVQWGLTTAGGVAGLYTIGRSIRKRGSDA